MPRCQPRDAIPVLVNFLWCQQQQPLPAQWRRVLRPRRPQRLGTKHRDASSLSSSGLRLARSPATSLTHSLTSLYCSMVQVFHDCSTQLCDAQSARATDASAEPGATFSTLNAHVYGARVVRSHCAVATHLVVERCGGREKLSHASQLIISLKSGHCLCLICDLRHLRCMCAIAARGERFRLREHHRVQLFALPLWHRKKFGAAPEPPQRAGRQTRTHARSERTEPVQCASRTHPTDVREPLHKLTHTLHACTRTHGHPECAFLSPMQAPPCIEHIRNFSSRGLPREALRATAQSHSPRLGVDEHRRDAARVLIPSYAFHNCSPPLVTSD